MQRKPLSISMMKLAKPLCDLSRPTRISTRACRSAINQGCEIPGTNNPNNFSDPLGLAADPNNRPWGTPDPNVEPPRPWGVPDPNYIPPPGWGNGYGYGNHHVGYDGGATYIDPVTGAVRNSATGEVLIANGNGHGAPTVPGGSASVPPQYANGNNPGYNISGPNFGGGNGVMNYGPGGSTTVVAYSSIDADIRNILGPRILPPPEGGISIYPRLPGVGRSPDGLGDLGPLPPGYDQGIMGPTNYPPGQAPSSPGRWHPIPFPGLNNPRVA